MVRMKQRYLICEIVTKQNKQLVRTGKYRDVNEDVYQCVKDAIITAHGDYGIGCVKGSLSVKYLNACTRTVMIRVKRGFHPLVIQSLVFIKKIGDMDVCFKTLYVGGSIRCCQNFLTRYHFWQLPVLLASCSTPEEKSKMEHSLKKALLKLNEEKSTK